MLVGVSTMLALRTGYEEVELTEAETRSWLKAAQKVARHYSIETTQKTLDWIAFAGVSAQVFGSRAVAVAVRRRTESPREPRTRPSRPAQVFPFPGRETAASGPPAPGAGPSVPPGPVEDQPEGGF